MEWGTANFLAWRSQRTGSPPQQGHQWRLPIQAPKAEFFGARCRPFGRFRLARCWPRATNTPSAACFVPATIYKRARQHLSRWEGPAAGPRVSAHGGREHGRESFRGCAHGDRAKLRGLGSKQRGSVHWRRIRETRANSRGSSCEVRDR